MSDIGFFEFFKKSLMQQFIKSRISLPLGNPASFDAGIEIPSAESLNGTVVSNIYRSPHVAITNPLPYRCCIFQIKCVPIVIHQ